MPICAMTIKVIAIQAMAIYAIPIWTIAVQAITISAITLSDITIYGGADAIAFVLERLPPGLAHLDERCRDALGPYIQLWPVIGMA